MGPTVTNMFLLPAAESVDSVPTSETKPDEGGSGSHQQSYFDVRNSTYSY